MGSYVKTVKQWSLWGFFSSRPSLCFREYCCKLWYLENIVFSSWPSIVCPTQTNKIELPLDYLFLYSTWPVFSNPNKNINFHNICSFWKLQMQILYKLILSQLKWLNGQTYMERNETISSELGGGCWHIARLPVVNWPYQRRPSHVIPREKLGRTSLAIRKTQPFPKVQVRGLNKLLKAIYYQRFLQTNIKEISIVCLFWFL